MGKSSWELVVFSEYRNGTLTCNELMTTLYVLASLTWTNSDMWFVNMLHIFPSGRLFV